MISFDVVSLFTNVPVAGAFDTIAALLEKDDSYEDHTAIPAADICNLAELCLRSTYFQFQDRFFEQVEGTAMGSPLSPVVANLFMEALESKALELSPLRLKMWVRYVDDTFVLWPHSEEELDNFHERLNSITPSIQFTCEKEREGTLPFLDVSLKREDDSISTRVHRKATHTDRYLHYTSHHHPHILTGVVQCLKRRAETVCVEQTAREELRHLQNTFEANGYPRSKVRHILNKVTTPRSETENSSDQEEQQKLLVLPYLRNTSEHIQRCCERLGIRAVFVEPSARLSQE